jgi:exodeoxyribonuclease-3
MVDTVRHHHPDTPVFSFWDYRRLAFPRNEGYRIDHILVTRPLLPRCREAFVDREARKGKEPSDHAPVVAVLDPL